MKTSLYYYRAVVCAVYDMDTHTVDIDLDLGSWIHGEKLRLYHIYAPELMVSKILKQVSTSLRVSRMR